jgi:DNA-binding CsgD family transcriptional regulator/tetratricopeptide (TPR) repeat protein
MDIAASSPEMASVVRGRDEQRAAIGQQVAATASGRSGVVFVAGRAGYGKTRLLAEAAEMGRRAGLRVGFGANLPGDQMVQMGAVLDAFFGGSDPILDRGALPELQALWDRRYWLIEQLETLVERAALQAPLMLAFDDVQWVDGGACAAVRALRARLADLPILWVLAFRSDEVPPGIQDGLDELARDGVWRLEVEALPDDAVSEVVEDLLQARPGPRLLDLVGRAQGSPFLLVELLRGLVEEGLVRTAAGGVELVEDRLPARVRDGIRDRLARMSPDARRAAQVASVVGSEFSFGWLASMLDLPPTALMGVVDKLLQAELLSDAAGQLRFRHDLLREAVLETLPLSTRRALQRQAAEVLMAGGAREVEVAILLAEGAEPGDHEAVAALLQAVRELGPQDPAVAADLGRRALDLAVVDDPLRGPLVAETALLLFAADRAEEGQIFADAALGAALPAEQQAEIRLSVAQMYSVPADVRVTNGQSALELRDVSEPLRTRHLAWLSHNLLGAGRVDEARALVDGGAEAEIQASGDERASFRMAVVVATLDFADGRYGRALERMDRLLGSAPLSAFDPALEVLRNETLAASGRLDEALAMIADAQASAQRDHHAYATRAWEQYRGRRLLELGRLSDAAAALEGSLAVHASLTAVHGADAPAVVALGRVGIHTADDRLTRMCGAQALKLLQGSAPEVRRHAAWLLMRQAMARSDHDGVREVLQALGDDARAAVLPQIRLDVTDEAELVRLALAIGDTELADRAASIAEQRSRLNPEADVLAATAAQAHGLRSGNRAALTDAVERFSASSRPLASASALEDLGRAQVRDGLRDDAVASLGRALETYVETGATWDAARVRGRLRTLGVRRRLARQARPSTGWAGLTDSELTIARLVAQGLTNREVAARLFLSPHTVSMHLRNAFAKLDINSRVELAQLERRHDPAVEPQGPPPK